MTRFHLITETDARTLERSSTVRLAAGGHITPLARDTLRERRVQVVREDGIDADPGALAPPERMRTVAIGGDEAARALVELLLAHVRARGLSAHEVDVPERGRAYPEAAAAVARRVADGEADAGIVADVTGFGSAVAANKVPGVRAAPCTSTTHARLAREDAGANVLALGVDLVGPDDARAIVDTFIGTAMRDPARRRLLAEVERLDRGRDRA